MFSRPVSPVEWWIAGHPGDTGPVLQVAVEGSGAVDEAALGAAVATASDACPGTRLVRRGRSWVDSGVPPRVRRVDLPARRSLLEVAQLHQSLPDKGGPTCEVLLVSGAVPALVFRASHAVMDAHGVRIWATDVFRALRGEQLLGAAGTATEADVFAGLPPPPKADAAGLAYPSLLGPRDPGAKRRVFWRRRTVDGYHPGLVAKLASVLRAHGASRFAVPVDLRRHLPGVRSTGCLSQSIPLDVPAGQSWERTHEDLLTLLGGDIEARSRLNPAVLKVPLPVLRLMTGALARRAVKTDRYASHASLAHLGRAEAADFSTPAFAATAVYSLSTPAAGGPVEIDLVECAGHTEITLAWHDGPGLRDKADELLDAVEELLSPPERRRWTANDVSTPLPDGRTVVQMFAEQAASTPDAIAVSGPRGDLTYAQLDQRSAGVAARLAEHGIGRDDVVAVLADRSADAVVAIWGTLRAGAGYLPLDAAHPDARLAGIITDARARVCLVQSPHQERAAVPAGCSPVLIDTVPPASFVDRVPRPEDLAYVIYTSGSTGRPKGVQIEHRGLLNYADWATRELGIDAGTRMPLLTSLAFDVSLSSIFLPLLAGGTVLLVDGELTHASLRDLLRDAGPTTLTMTPSLLELVCQLDVRPTGVRVVAAAGELLSRSLALRAQQMFGPRCRVLNLYGPTEATIECIAHQFDAARDTTAAVPIGRPTQNCTAYVLDAQHRFVAPGELGELHVGGGQLARGYLGMPELTRERFVHLADGTRVYRTGDLTRMLPSGALEYIGRIDDQVKVLGHRIEPAEISQALQACPGVERAVVVAQGRPHKTLCAYVVGAGLDPAALTDYLTERLPRYMVPAVITAVDDIPRTTNGKVDVRALPDPFATGAAGSLPPDRDPFGAAVAAIWADTLGVDPDRLGDDADFHQLGGDSLLMLSMLAGVCRKVVGSGAEQRFMSHLGDIVREPTIHRVTEIARKVADSGAARHEEPTHVQRGQAS